MSDIWRPWNMSRCDCETKEHSYFCAYYQYRRVLDPKIGTEIRPVKETRKEETE